MNKSHIIISGISISIMIVVGTILFSHPDLVMVTNYIIVTSTQNFVKNLTITLFCGSGVYTVLYGIPHEYKVVNKKTDQKKSL